MRNSLKWFAVFGLSATFFASLLFAQNEGAVEALLADLAGGNDGDVELQAAEGAEATAAPEAATVATETSPAVVAEPAPAVAEEVVVAPAAEEVVVAEEAAPAVVAEPAPVVAEVPVAEPPAPVVAAEEAVAVEEEPAVVAVAPAEEDSTVAKAEETSAVAPAEESAPAAETAATQVADDDAALISELEELETIRIRALDAHGLSTVEAARKAMDEKDYDVAAAQYQKSLEFLGDRPQNAELRKEANEGIAEANYRDALRLLGLKNYEQAEILAVKSIDAGHERAPRLLETIKEEKALSAKAPRMDSISHRVNEQGYKDMRSEIRPRLRKARQFLATGEYSKALEQCELVLRDYPETREAVDLRTRIAQKMKTFSDAEFEATRTMMIRDVRDTWNTRRYAIDSAEVPKGKMEMTTKRQSSEIASGRTAEQVIQQKLEEIVLPEVSFRPPATIIDAVTFFDNAAREYDKPDLPMSERGVNIVLKLPNQNAGAAAAEPAASEDDPFAASAGASAGASADGVPVIPALSARFITLKNALKLVCDVTGMKSLIRGNVVMVVPQNEPDTELLTRSYNVLASLTDRISSAQSEMGSSSKRGDEQFMETADMSGKQDWKSFFGELGVQWPEGSSIAYISTIGKLRVKNTAENLAVFEQVLEDLNVTPRLIEIEARFVDVSQEDLNSLGFEWLINSDLSFEVGGWLGKQLKNYTGSGSALPLFDQEGNVIKGAFVDGVWDPDAIATYKSYEHYRSPGYVALDPKAPQSALAVYNNGGVYANGKGPAAGQIGSVYNYDHNMSINAIDGNTYSTGLRHLNTVGNHIAGENGSINDQFMRVNAFLGNADISMILHMLAQRNDTDLLNAPRVVTKNGQEAIMKVVTEYRYPTEYDVEISQNGSSSGSTSGNSADPIATVEPQNFEMREVGTILQVVPEVSPEGQMINLMLNPQVVSEPTWKNYGTKLPKTTYRKPSVAEMELLKLAAGEQIAETGYIDLPMEQPFFSIRSVQTQLSVYNGATVVIGGLITEVRKAMEDKIPFLGDIPYIGRLFRSKSEMSQKRNLLIFITAKLVDPSGKVIRPSDDSALLQNAEGSAGVSAGAAAAPAAADAADDDEE